MRLRISKSQSRRLSLSKATLPISLRLWFISSVKTIETDRSRSALSYEMHLFVPFPPLTRISRCLWSTVICQRHANTNHSQEDVLILWDLFRGAALLFRISRNHRYKGDGF
jgi:hypothetical protein